MKFKLFVKKPKQQEQDAVAAILNPETLTVNPEPSTTEELEKIIKTTDSMNIISELDGEELVNKNFKKTSSEMAGIRESIFRSFDLARRKISTEYEQVIVSGNFVDNPFFAVQITVKNYERNWKVDYVESVIRTFTDAIPEQLSMGRTVHINNDLVIEPVIYIDKVLPSWKITPEFALLTNALRWTDLFDLLVNEGKLSQDAKDIIAEFIEAVDKNVKNGYYVKLSRFIVLQIYPNSAQKIVLFSNDTLKKMNNIYARYLKTGERKQISKFDAVSHFERTEEHVKNEFLNQDTIDVIQESSFEPRDLVETIEFDVQDPTVVLSLEKETKAKDDEAIEPIAMVDSPVKEIEDIDGLEISDEDLVEISDEDLVEISDEDLVEEVVKKPTKKGKKKAPIKVAIKKTTVKAVAKKPAKKAEVKPVAKAKAPVKKAAPVKPVAKAKAPVKKPTKKK